jgi:hypothetical protein
MKEVVDEIVNEAETEVKLFTTGVYEDWPDEHLPDEYYESLRKFVLSENHLQCNINSVKIAQLSANSLYRGCTCTK